MSKLRGKTVKALKWNFLNVTFGQGVSFIISVILARILFPRDFGLIGLLNVFLAFANSLTDSGFSAAIIQKQNTTQQDYSTAFFTNILLGIFFFAILILIAPHISEFYSEPQLTLITQVVAINLIITPFGIIQISLFKKELKYKQQFIANFTSIILSGILGIFLAIEGYGVWSIVFQLLSQNVVKVIIYWSTSKWRPTLTFSVKSFKTLFDYGSKILGSSLLEIIFNNIFIVIIGKIFSVTDVGFFRRAKTLQEMPSSLIYKGLLVVFPSFSKIQNDNLRLKKGFKKAHQLIAFINYPLMTLLFVFAEPIILVLLTDKWLPILTYFRIFCIAGLVYPHSALAVNVFLIKGDSGVYLKIDIIKRLIMIIAIAVSINWGVYGLVLGYSLSVIISYFINIITSGKTIQYGLVEHCKDTLPYLLSSIIVGIGSIITPLEVGGYLTNIAIQGSVFITLYLLTIHLLKLEALSEVWHIILNKF
jgi:O-antigen/teichoic acid export membrane protein